MNPYIKGWLLKSPPENAVSHPFKKFFVAKWRRRYFVLYGPPSSTMTFRNVTAILDYYTDDDLRCKKGSIDLSECDQVRSHLDCGPYKHVFSFEGRHGNGKRVFFLSAESDSHRNDWIDSIRSLLGLSNASESPPTRHATTRSTSSLSGICKLDQSLLGLSTYEKLAYANRNFDHKYEKLLTKDLKLSTVQLNFSTLPASKISARHTAANLSFSCPLADTPRKSLPNSSYSGDGYSTIRNLGPTPVSTDVNHDPTPPPIRPRTKMGDIKTNDLDVEVPLSRPKSDSQRDSGFAGDETHETPYYKMPRHKYNYNYTNYNNYSDYNDDDDDGHKNNNTVISNSIANQTTTSESQIPNYTKPSNIRLRNNKQAFQPKITNIPERSKKLNRSVDDCEIISNCTPDDCCRYDNYLNEMTPRDANHPREDRPMKLINESRNTLYYDVPGSPRSLEKMKRINEQFRKSEADGYQNMNKNDVTRDAPVGGSLISNHNTHNTHSHYKREPAKHRSLRVRFEPAQKQHDQRAEERQGSLSDRSFSKLLSRFRLSSKSE